MFGLIRREFLKAATGFLGLIRWGSGTLVSSSVRVWGIRGSTRVALYEVDGKTVKEIPFQQEESLLVVSEAGEPLRFEVIGEIGPEQADKSIKAVMKEHFYQKLMVKEKESAKAAGITLPQKTGRVLPIGDRLEQNEWRVPKEYHSRCGVKTVNDFSDEDSNQRRRRIEALKDPNLRWGDDL